MAAGAILPPLFFERRRHVSLFAPGMAFSGTSEKHDARKNTSVDHAVGRPAQEAWLPATGHRKDI
jgi:hypothetical protein